MVNALEENVNVMQVLKELIAQYKHAQITVLVMAYVQVLLILNAHVMMGLVV
jgi:hypothetical protein